MMGDRRAALIAFLVLFSLVASLPNIAAVRATEDSWTTMAPLPTLFYSTLGAAEVDGKIYFIGSNINAQYDPETNNWTEIAPLPIYNDWGTVVACQNKIYVIGGDASIPTQVYDPVTDTWENRTSIPTTRYFLQANVVDGKIYVIGGQIPSALGVVNPSSANDVYDPETDSWSNMTPIPTPVMGYASAVVDNKIYIIGGGIARDLEYIPVDQVQIFDPKTNQWTNGTPITTGVCYASACATTGLLAPKRIYVFGGSLTYYFRYAFSAVTDLNQMYDPETETWTTGTSMPTPRCKLGVAVVNDELYAIGGHNASDWGDVVSANEKYTPIGYIPEFPSWTTLLIMLIAVVAVMVTYRHNLHKQNQRRKKH